MGQVEDGMVRFFIDAGRRGGVRPGDLVGAIANEAGIPGKSIGAIDIYDRFSFVEVPTQYRDQVLERMRRTTIRNQPISIKVATPDQGERSERPRRDSTRDGKKAYTGKRTSRPRRS
jgi:hypothetical protein